MQFLKDVYSLYVPELVWMDYVDAADWNRACCYSRAVTVHITEDLAAISADSLENIKSC